MFGFFDRDWFYLTQTNSLFQLMTVILPNSAVLQSAFSLKTSFAFSVTKSQNQIKTTGKNVIADRIGVCNLNWLR